MKIENGLHVSDTYVEISIKSSKIVPLGAAPILAASCIFLAIV